jgi:hypothetical protein
VIRARARGETVEQGGKSGRGKKSGSGVAKEHSAARFYGRFVHSQVCQIGYVDHTGCHRLVFLTIRSTRVVTPGCQIGYVDHTAVTGP